MKLLAGQPIIVIVTFVAFLLVIIINDAIVAVCIQKCKSTETSPDSTSVGETSVHRFIVARQHTDARY